MKNSVNTNLLILDEVFDSSLDTNGTDDFLKLLNTLTEKTNAFIISHKGDVLYDKFENVIRFEKHKNFSRIAEQINSSMKSFSEFSGIKRTTPKVISELTVSPDYQQKGVFNPYYTLDTKLDPITNICLLYTSPSPRDKRQSRMPSSA